MCNALSPEKAVIWSILHGAPTDRFSAETFRYAPYRSWFQAATRLKDAGCALSLEALTQELTRTGARPTAKDIRALKRMLKTEPPARIRDNADAFMRALDAIQDGQPVELHRFIN